MRFRFGLQARVALVALLLMLCAALAPAMVGHATLSGTTFDAHNGNMVPTTAGTTDWNTAPNLSIGVDLASGSGDNSFGQGTKENSPNPTVVNGSIPPNKNDLQRFYVAGQNIGTGANRQTFLYLAWTRAVNIGSADIDFELNQHVSPTFTANSSGTVTLNRTIGDILFLYDFAGSGTPSVSYAVWGGTSWGPQTAFANGNSEASVNTAAISDPLNGNRSLGVGLFGEASINLTAAGLIPANSCNTFSSAFTKSRSSNSFTAELKDFIAPIPVSITNCGAAVVQKTDAQTGLLLAGAQFVIVPGANQAAISPMVESSAGVFCQDNLAEGTHVVTETVAPVGYDLANPDHQTVTVSNFQTCAQRLAANSVDATFADPPQLGAIEVDKSSSKGGTALGGAVFDITGPSGYDSGPITTTAGGTVCVENLHLGNYHVRETAAPAGYAINNTASVTETISGDSSCAGTPVVARFSDSPLSNITLTMHSLAGAGVTNATVTCTGAGTVSSTTLQDAQSVTTTNVVGTGDLTCQVHIDP